MIAGRPVIGLPALYAMLTLIGTVLPLSRLLPWVADHGPDPASFVAELFSTRIGGFFGWDVIVSAVVLILFIRTEGKGVPRAWLAIAATLLVGVSCGLPLFLALRARHAERSCP